MSFFSAFPAASRLRIKPILLRLLGIAAVSLLAVPQLEAGEVEVAWNANPTDEEITGYRLHYGITSGHYENTDDVGSTSSATLKDLGDDMRYFIALTAYNKEGLESEFSEELEFTTPAVSNEIDTDPEIDDDVEGEEIDGTNGDETPDTGTSEEGNDAEVEAVLPGGDATAELIWNPNPETDGVTGYRLYYGTSSGSYPAMLDTGNSTSVRVMNLAENTTYFVVLTAYNEEGLESPPSDEFQFLSSTNLPPEIILTKIGGEDITSTNGSLILLATARDEDGYVSRVDFYDGTRLLHSDGDFPYALRVSGLTVGQHQLRAVAVDNFGEATESKALSLKIDATIKLPDPAEQQIDSPEPQIPTLTLTPAISGKTPLFTVTATPGSLVQLEASADLSNWMVVSESSADDSGNVEITDPTPEEELPAQRFYRVVTP